MTIQHAPQTRLAFWPIMLWCVFSIVMLAACSRGAATTSLNLPDIPIHPDAELVEAVVGEDLDPTEYYVVTTAEATDVMAWYREEMASAGWIANSGDPESDFVYYHTDEGCYGFVAVFASDDGQVELQLSQQRPGTRCFVYLTPDPSGGDD